MTCAAVFGAAWSTPSFGISYLALNNIIEKPKLARQFQLRFESRDRIHRQGSRRHRLVRLTCSTQAIGTTNPYGKKTHLRFHGREVCPTEGSCRKNACWAVLLKTSNVPTPSPLSFRS
jgi:hypothetical protein